MKIVSIANNLTLNHLPGGLSVKSFTLIRSLVPGSWADFMVIPGRRATFMHCSRASGRASSRPQCPGRNSISFLKAFSDLGQVHGSGMNDNDLTSEVSVSKILNPGHTNSETSVFLNLAFPKEIRNIYKWA